MVLQQSSSRARGVMQSGTPNLHISAVCLLDLIKYYFLNNIFNES